MSRLDELANHIEGIRVVSFVQLLMLLLLESGVLVKRIVVTETLVSGVVVLLLMRMTVMADQVGV